MTPRSRPRFVLAAAVLATLLLPAAHACTASPPREEDLVVRDLAQGELLRLGAGLAPYPCSSPPRPAMQLDVHLLVWKGTAHHLATGRSQAVGSGPLSLAGGRVLALEEGGVRVHDVANGTSLRRDPPFAASLLSEGVAAAMVDGRLRAHDVLAGAALDKGATAQDHGAPANATLAAVSRAWTVFQGTDGRFWASREGEPARAFAVQPFWDRPWRAERIVGDRLVLSYDRGISPGAGYIAGRAALHLGTGASEAESAVFPAHLRATFEPSPGAGLSSPAPPLAASSSSPTGQGQAVDRDAPAGP